MTTDREKAIEARSMIDKAALRALCERASPGPFFATDIDYEQPDAPEGMSLAEAAGNDECWTVSRHPGVPGWNHDGGYPGYGLARHDAEFFAEARTALPALLDEIDTLTSRAEAAERRVVELEGR